MLGLLKRPPPLFIFSLASLSQRSPTISDFGNILIKLKETLNAETLHAPGLYGGLDNVVFLNFSLHLLVLSVFQIAYWSSFASLPFIFNLY